MKTYIFTYMYACMCVYIYTNIYEISITEHPIYQGKLPFSFSTYIFSVHVFILCTRMPFLILSCKHLGLQNKEWHDLLQILYHEGQFGTHNVIGKALTTLVWLVSHPHGWTVIEICCRLSSPEADSRLEIIVQKVFRECFQDFNICVGREAEGLESGRSWTAV